MAHLFFSYAHSDYERLLPIFQRMELVTERMIWIDRIGLQRDMQWAEMIQRAISSSYGVIFAVTKEFVRREFILHKEIPWALERFNDSRQGKLIFPILFDDVPLPEAFNAPNVNFCKQVLDARDGDTERM